LNEFLNTAEGEKLKDLYDPKIWSSVRVDNSISLIPIGVLKNAGITFAFNKAYVSEKDLEGFEGDISQLEDIMKKLPFKEGFSHMVYDFDGIDDD